jgi:hypothetical protein
VGGQSNHGVSRGEAAGGSSVALSPSPAADVCEWTLHGYPIGCKTECGQTIMAIADQRVAACPSCRKPILFKEPTP